MTTNGCAFPGRTTPRPVPGCVVQGLCKHALCLCMHTSLGSGGKWGARWLWTSRCWGRLMSTQRGRLLPRRGPFPLLLMRPEVPVRTIAALHECTCAYVCASSCVHSSRAGVENGPRSSTYTRIRTVQLSPGLRHSMWETCRVLEPCRRDFKYYFSNPFLMWPKMCHRTSLSIKFPGGSMRIRKDSCLTEVSGGCEIIHGCDPYAIPGMY